MINNIFSFYISKHEANIEQLPQKQKFGDYFIYTDNFTPFEQCEIGDRRCAIFGYGVDVVDSINKDLPKHMIQNTKDLSEVIDFEARLGGKYVIFYQDNSGYYMLGDATCSIPVYYYKGEMDFVCASNPMLIVNLYGLTKDEKLQHIRKSGDISQAMPFDVTEYFDILQLIPNHYLSFNNKKAVRFINFKSKEEFISFEEAAQKTAPMIKCLTKFYMDNFKIYCPITSGRDSRVVLAFLTNLSDDFIDSYTIKHKKHRDNDQDLTVPEELSKKCKMNYRQVSDVDAKKETVNAMDNWLGAGRYSIKTLNIANTVKTHFNDGAIINGDIIGQVGKCSLHRDIPRIFATAGYFRCKMHNFSKEAKQFLRLWLKEIKASGEKVNTFDLFSVENRMGRWAGQENLIYNSMGQLYLNVFNCRKIIYTWAKVKRGERKYSLIHSGLIKTQQPSLLEVPFHNDSSKFITICKSNGLFYFISSYLKFYMQKIRFNKEN